MLMRKGLRCATPPVASGDWSPTGRIRPTASCGRAPGGRAGYCDRQQSRCERGNRGDGRGRGGLAEKCASWLCSFCVQRDGANRSFAANESAGQRARARETSRSGYAKTSPASRTVPRNRQTGRVPRLQKKARPSRAEPERFGRGCLKGALEVRLTPKLCKCEMTRDDCVFCMARWKLLKKVIGPSLSGPAG